MDDIRVIEGCRQACLAKKEVDQLRLRSKLRHQLLEHDLLFEALEPDLFAEIHLAHAAFGKAPEDHIPIRFGL